MDKKVIEATDLPETRGRKTKYPFAQMRPPQLAPGGEWKYDCFFVPGRRPAELYSTVNYWRKKNPEQKFTLRVGIVGKRRGAWIYRIK